MQPSYAVQDDVARPSTPDRAFHRDDTSRAAVRERVLPRPRQRLGELADRRTSP